MKNYEINLLDNLLLSTNKEMLNLEYIYHYLDKLSYWSQGLPYQRFQTAVNNSLCYGLYQNKKQIGFARVVTDFSESASLWDVFIDPEQQGKGYGKAFVQAIFESPLTKDVFKWFLMTEDAHTLYERFGFTTNSPKTVMTLITKRSF